ncbi:Na-translocating system protein MpsC family protein [Ammoniphilus sp. CFH 90114]|uniref:Na-translocating system protein MpsC family protein n=1 Tax=Ammoniphilus sp. CFH 90114 TaxID=2493665 RepID=UPI00100FD3BC|nr:Na-translocating system protein MpsC family protein [Ammoniphilus sp. CFH 90114]RXT15537.1 DUF2294 family protein [Ammoniphilus sp. CFH 90114]
MIYSAGQMKQELIRDYQEINQHLFEIGTKQQRVEFVSDKILIMTVHRRAPAIRSLDMKRRDVTRVMDILLVDEFKEHFKNKLETKYGFKVVTILKDYDPLTELSATVVVIDREVEDYLG